MKRHPLSTESMEAILAPEPSANEVEKADEAIGPEMYFVAGYLINDLTPSERVEFENRMEADEAFRDEVEPVLLAWQHAPNFLAEEPISDAEVRRSWLEFRRKVGMPSLLPDVLETNRRRYAAAPGDSKTRRVLQLAGALVAIVVVLVLGYINFNGIPEWALPGALHTAIAPTLPGPDQQQITGRSEPGGMAISVYPDDGATVTLDHGARLTWHDRADSVGVRELRMDGGDASFFLNPFPKGEEFRIVTPAAILRVTELSSFTVHQVNPSVTLVNLATGRVILSSRGGLELSIKQLRPGERGRAEFGFPAEVIK